MRRHILITGCSGGGKSTLLSALAATGHAVVAEPGRRVIAARPDALPWENPEGFARSALAMATQDESIAMELVNLPKFAEDMKLDLESGRLEIMHRAFCIVLNLVITQNDA